MWTSISTTPENVSPSSRTKHSATQLGSHVYLFGGKNGNLPLKDFWQYSITEGKWTQLEPMGDCPPCLQEHSAVAYKDCIYVFGGEIGFSAGTETPLWIYNVKSNTWKKIRGQKGAVSPKGRRGHTALVHRGRMIIYGGYQDLRGSSSELWSYHFETESWHLLSSKSSSDSLQKPSGRHKHSAVLHDGAMWVYGGMTDLQEKGDLWRWDIVSKLWYNIKTKTNPGTLHSHAACKLPSSMLIFGGESNGQLSNDLWRFHFGTEIWEKLQFPGSKPHPRAESIALTVSELFLTDKANANSGVRTHFSSEDSEFQKNSSNHSKNFGHNKIGPFEKKNSINECSKNHTTGNIMSNVVNNNNLNFLKEISKLSSINLLKLNYKCSYSVLNSSHDSTESLLKGKEGSDTEHTPTRMVKSQSASFIANNEKKKNTFSTLTPATEKMPYSIKESIEFLPVETDKAPKTAKPHSPVLVPNSNDPPASNLMPNDQNELDLNNSKMKNLNKNIINKNGPKILHKDGDNNKINLPGTPINQDAKTIEPKVTNSDNYSFSKRFQSDSYTSHLVTLGDEEMTEWSGGIPKSASVVRFKKQIEVADELTSDYCSIETVNKISSSSNYSQSPGEAHKDIISDYPELKFGKSTDSSIKKAASNRNTSYGFSNPNYLGPEVKTILKTKDIQNYAKMLNSPPDSVLEEVGKTANQNENVEMKNMATSNNSKQIEFKLSKQVRSPPKYLPLRGNPYNTTTVPISADKKKKFRASSASRADKQGVNPSFLQRSINEEFSGINLESRVPLSVFLIGGKEHGQITVFKRPISLWKLRLSSNIY